MFSSNKDYIKFDDVSIAANLQVFQPYLREVEELFNLYANIINPLIIEYEVEKTEFPVEILNEIRAIVSHLVRASVSSDDSEVHENIKKSKSHAKRAILDGDIMNSSNDIMILWIGLQAAFRKIFMPLIRIVWKR